MSDVYINSIRKRGNIISFYAIRRSQSKENERLNRHSEGYGDGLFLPKYFVSVYRFDCLNDRYSTETHILSITNSDDGIYEGKFVYTIDPKGIDYRVIRGQEKVFIEGRPYWAMRSRNRPNYDFGDGGASDWTQVRPGSYAASHLDYACEFL